MCRTGFKSCQVCGVLQLMLIEAEKYEFFFFGSAGMKSMGIWKRFDLFSTEFHVLLPWKRLFLLFKHNYLQLSMFSIFLSFLLSVFSFT